MYGMNTLDIYDIAIRKLDALNLLRSPKVPLMILQLLRRHFFRIEDEYVLALRARERERD